MIFFNESSITKRPSISGLFCFSRPNQKKPRNEMTSTIRRAMNMWLESSNPSMQLCGQRLRDLMRPLEFDGPLSPHVPPMGGIPDVFRCCPWYVSDAFNNCTDPEMKPRFMEMRDCVLLENDDAIFGLTYVPPHVYYPPHNHQPLEPYHVLSGEGRFVIAGEGDIQQVSEGAIPKSIDVNIYGADDFWVHLPYQAHAMQTFDQPVFFLWGWVGHLKEIDYSYLKENIFELTEC